MYIYQTLISLWKKDVFSGNHLGDAILSIRPLVYEIFIATVKSQVNVNSILKCFLCFAIIKGNIIKTI